MERGKTLMNSFMFNLAYVNAGVSQFECTTHVHPWSVVIPATCLHPHTWLEFFVGRLIMLCVLPCVQFCTQAFNTYARLTDADVLFSSTMKYLKFFKYFWSYNAFLFGILAIVGIAGAYFVRRTSSVDAYCVHCCLLGRGQCVASHEPHRSVDGGRWRVI